MKTVIKLLKLISPYSLWMTLAAFLGFATVGCSIGLMATAAYIIAYSALHPPLWTLQLAIVGVRFFGIFRGVFRYFERLLSHNVTFKILKHLRVWFYKTLEPLAPARLLEYKSGDILSRIIADIETLENFFVRVISPPLVLFLTFVSMFLFFKHFEFSLAYLFVFFVILASFILPVIWLILARGPGERSVLERARLHAEIVDSVQGLAELMVFNAFENELEKILENSKSFEKQNLKISLIETLQEVVNLFLANIAMFIAVILGAKFVGFKFSGPYLAVIALAFFSSFEAFLPLNQTVQNLKKSSESADRLFEIVSAKPEVEEPLETKKMPKKFDITFENLEFGYNKDRPVLKNLTFHIPEGSKVAIVGPSGAGKTTILNLLMRFWDYHKGRILIGDIEIKEIEPERIRAMISVVPQNPYLFNGTISQNLKIAKPDASFEELVIAAKKSRIHDFIMSLPDGYETWIGEQGLLLSGGERQRLAIARAILKDAPIFILDEVTANLDPITEEAIMDSLLTSLENKTTIFITHRLLKLEKMDQIIVLHHGRIIEKGTHNELMTLKGFYYRMWKLQHEIIPF